MDPVKSMPLRRQRPDPLSSPAKLLQRVFFSPNQMLFARANSTVKIEKETLNRLFHV